MASQRTAEHRISILPAHIRMRLDTTLCVIGLLLGGVPGCDRTQETVQSEVEQVEATPGHYVSAAVSPKSILDECVRSYRRLTSYEDSAYVQLKYRIGEKWHQDRAPLKVAWAKQAPGEASQQLLGLQVYSTLAGPDGDRWRARIDRSDLAESNQVLSRAIPERVDFAWLLDDTVVAQSLSAGLAGFPPQLDLLLSETPLSGLVHDATELKLMRPASLNGRLCHVISIEVAGRSYQLWVDQASMLLRRLVMPQQNIPRELLGTQGVEDVELSVELASIRVGEAIDWGEYRVPVEPEDYLVNHFVAPPVQWDTGGLGVQVPAFRLKNGQGIPVFETGRGAQPGEPEIKVLVWLANHPSSQLAAEQVAMVADLLEGDVELEDRVRFVPIWAEPTPPQGMSFKQLRDAWELPGEIAVDSEAVGRDLFQVEEAPTLVVLDGENRIQLRENSSNPMLARFLPTILRRLNQGVDIAAEFIQDARNVSRRSFAELQAALAIDNKRVLNGNAAADYWPQWVELIHSSATNMQTELLAASLDTSGHIWALDRSGTLTEWSTAGREFSQKNAWPNIGVLKRGGKMRVSAAADLVAIAGLESSPLKVVHTKHDRGFDVSISPGDAVLEMEWVSVAADSRPRLAVTTLKSQLLLIDPANQEQLSARCPSKPVALLPRRLESNEVGGVVVLADRSVQPIRLGKPRQGTPEQRTLSMKVEEKRDGPELDSEATGEVVLIGYRTPLGSSPSKENSALLPFQPAAGGWLQLISDERSFTLGRGWLAKDEPAAFLLDSDLKPIWHRRLPLLSETIHKGSVSGCIDPKSGQPVWLLVDTDSTIHLFRADGLADHFRFREPVLNVSLLTAGSELNMCVARADRIELFRVQWR
ncbi:MAG: hypothetical protein AAGG44_00365 [Planctomycetota bacterium]